MQVYKESKATSNITGNLNKGSYTVSFDLNNNEANSSLRIHFLMIKSSASIDDVKRNIRYIISSVLKHFVFLSTEIILLIKYSVGQMVP